MLQREAGIAVLPEQGDYLRQGRLQVGFERMRRITDDAALCRYDYLKCNDYL